MTEQNSIKDIPCAYCRQKPAERDSGFWPFCCERCKMSDLGRWATGDYAIPCQNLDEEMIDELESTLSAGSDSEDQ